ALTRIVPAGVKYQNILLENLSKQQQVLGAAGKKTTEGLQTLVSDISNHINTIIIKVDEMIEERKKANNISDSKKRAIAYCEKVKPYFDEIRYHADKLEIIVDDELWSLPKFRELLFTK
ncbi:MAG TPA: glutamine synthetase type III, partial [Flavobacteriales bacterium]|nr:glutamine synthetase type III [Flavobacteriales bacterium]